MRIEDKKYVWWGLLGIGVAAFFYFLSSRQKSTNAGTTIVPYLVPQTLGGGASPTADTSLSNQPNIIGSSSNSQVPNFSNPYSMNVNPFEAPGSWGWMPNLNASAPTGPNNNIQSGYFFQPQGVIQQNAVNPPGSNYQFQSATQNH